MREIDTFGTIWPDWIIDEEIGHGSFGTVYKAHRQDGYTTARQVAAVKHIGIPGKGADDSSIYSNTSLEQYYTNQLNTLVREIDTMVCLRNQPHIVAYEEHRIFRREYGVGYDLFLRMELLTSLPAYLRQNHEINRDLVIRLGLDLSEALEIMESHNIIHRDIKPANVFVDDRGSFKLGDFGTARVLSANQNGSFRTGTVFFMAPEVYSGGEKYDRTVDIYSLGMMLYMYMNNGLQPWQDPEVFDPEGPLIRRMQGDQLPPPCLADDRLAAVILKCCMPAPADRYQSAAELKRDLQACLQKEPDQAPDWGSVTVHGDDPIAAKPAESLPVQ